MACSLFTGGRLPPLVTLVSQGFKDLLFGSRRQLFHQLNHLLIG
jgi:hypothetical protein